MNVRLSTVPDRCRASTGRGNKEGLRICRLSKVAVGALIIMLGDTLYIYIYISFFLRKGAMSERRAYSKLNSRVKQEGSDVLGASESSETAMDCRTHVAMGSKEAGLAGIRRRAGRPSVAVR